MSMHGENEMLKKNYFSVTSRRKNCCCALQLMQHRTLSLLLHIRPFLPCLHNFRSFIGDHTLAYTLLLLLLLLVAIGYKEA